MESLLCFQYLFHRLLEQCDIERTPDAHRIGLIEGATGHLAHLRCKPDLALPFAQRHAATPRWRIRRGGVRPWQNVVRLHFQDAVLDRSDEHTSELQSLMRISYAVFCLKKKPSTETIPHCTANRKMNDQNTRHS